MRYSRSLLILGFIILGILSRFLPHPPNFTALNSIALLSVSALGHLGLSFFVVLSTMFLSDMVIGLHPTLSFVYFSFGCIILMGHWLRLGNHTYKRLPLFCIASSLLFFIITNFGVWLIDPLYPKTYSGLMVCYLAAVPFLVNQILGDVFYGMVLFTALRTIKTLRTIRT